ncbi:unnamed protein product [Schistocephalus solidus]|uniref:Uncharacterized protein n=1 Tax=Schistocephalus solidus TaxID=70667 RepID=A0A183TPX1_SCHSO|nr:unnamed protein product [Schistocephalus solidus]
MTESRRPELERAQMAGAAGAAPRRTTTPGLDPTEWECHKGHIKKEPLQPDSQSARQPFHTKQTLGLPRVPPPSKPVSCLMWEWAHWLTDRRTRIRAPKHDLTPITNTPGFPKSEDMEEPLPSDSQSTGQPLDTQHIHWAYGVNWYKRQIGSLPSHGF